MKKEKKWKTAFRIRYDFYEYTVMFFELINASTSCQKLFNNTLQEYLNIFVIIYLNDILIFSQTEEAHKEHVKKMLKCLNARNLLLKSEKCQWHKQKVDFLNYVVKINEMKIDLNKVQSVNTWSKSINVKKLQAFLSFVNYNRKFIRNYFKKTLLLTNLTNKNKSWL